MKESIRLHCPTTDRTVAISQSEPFTVTGVDPSCATVGTQGNQQGLRCMLVSLCALVPKVSILSCFLAGFRRFCSSPSLIIPTMALTLSVQTGNCVKPSKHFLMMNQLTSSSENILGISTGNSHQAVLLWWTVGGWSACSEGTTP